MAGIQLGFNTGHVVTEPHMNELQRNLGPVVAVESNANGLFLFFSGYSTEESAQHGLNCAISFIPGVVPALCEASPTL
jgi:hypothetical protein